MSRWNNFRRRTIKIFICWLCAYEKYETPTKSMKRLRKVWNAYEKSDGDLNLHDARSFVVRLGNESFEDVKRRLPTATKTTTHTHSIIVFILWQSVAAASRKMSKSVVADEFLTYRTRRRRARNRARAARSSNGVRLVPSPDRSRTRRFGDDNLAAAARRSCCRTRLKYPSSTDVPQRVKSRVFQAFRDYDYQILEVTEIYIVSIVKASEYYATRRVF